MKAIIEVLVLLLYKGEFRFGGKGDLGFYDGLRPNDFWVEKIYPIKIKKPFYIFCTKEKVYYSVFSKDWK